VCDFDHNKGLVELGAQEGGIGEQVEGRQNSFEESHDC